MTQISPKTTASAYELLGGSDAVRRLAARFYEVMDADEPALAKLHRLDDQGRVHPDSRERFAMFFIGWLGGPQDYMAQHGHPRLRMRHGNVPIDIAMRDAWMRAMTKAMDDCGVSGPVRRMLDTQLADLANFLRNTPG